MAVAPRAFRLAPGMAVTPLVLLCRASPFSTEFVVLKPSRDGLRWKSHFPPYLHPCVAVPGAYGKHNAS